MEPSDSDLGTCDMTHAISVQYARSSDKPVFEDNNPVVMDRDVGKQIEDKRREGIDSKIDRSADEAIRTRPTDRVCKVARNRFNRTAGRSRT